MKEIKELKTQLEKIRLTEEEKNTGREAFLAYMQKHPHNVQPRENFVQHFLSRVAALSRRPVATAFATLTVFVLLGGGVTYAAQGSMPGEFLYPVKLNVNEQVEGFFKFTPKSEAEWEFDRMQRRFDELENLREQGALDKETKFKIREEIKDSNFTLQEHLKDLREEGDLDGALDIKNRFNQLFQNHQDAALDIEFTFPPEGDEEIDATQSNQIRTWPPLINPDGVTEDTEKTTEVEADPPIETNVDATTETDADASSIDSSVDLEVEIQSEDTNSSLFHPFHIRNPFPQ